MDWKQVTDRPNEIIDQRGGTQSLKEDAEELKDIIRVRATWATRSNAPWTRPASRVPLTKGPRVKRSPAGAPSFGCEGKVTDG
jgi:hypothetical protein